MKNIFVLILFSCQFYWVMATHIITGTISNNVNSCEPIETSGMVTVQQGASVKIISNSSVLLKPGISVNSSSGTNLKIYISATECCSCGDNFTDTRNNKTYPTVGIGDQCWMAKSLNYNTSFKPNNDASNLDNYGGLYTYLGYMNGSIDEGAQGVCPSGWHIPTVAELSVLRNNFSTSSDVYNALIEGGSSGFNAKLAGYHLITSMGPVSMNNFEKEVIFVSSSISEPDYYYGLFLRHIDSDGNTVNTSGFYGAPFNYASSVRCIKDCSGSSLKASYANKNITQLIEYQKTSREKQIKLYFNQSSNKLIIESLTDFETCIFDLSGRKVLNIAKSSNSIDISEFNPGIYIVHITSAGKTYKQKIVKQ